MSCLVYLIMFNLFSDKFVFITSKIYPNSSIIIAQSKTSKIPYNLKIAIEYAKESLKRPTFNCEPIPGGAKLYEVEYDLLLKQTNITINEHVIKQYFKSSANSIECSLNKFEKNEKKYENAKDALKFSTNFNYLNSRNGYSTTIHG